LGCTPRKPKKQTVQHRLLSRDFTQATAMRIEVISIFSNCLIHLIAFKQFGRGGVSAYAVNGVTRHQRLQ